MNIDDEIDWAALSGPAQEAARKGLVQAAEHVRGVASEGAPKDTGHLAGSGHVDYDGSDEAAVKFDGPYARYQEFGVYYRHGVFGAPLRHDNGHSFYLTMAMAAERDAVLSIIARSVKEAL